MISGNDQAKKYARAYLNVYGHALEIEDIHHYQQALPFLKHYRSLIIELCIYQHSAPTRNSFFSLIIEHFKLHDSCKRLIEFLYHKNMVQDLNSIIQDIITLYMHDHKILSVHISTATETSQETILRLTKLFTQHSGWHASITHSIDPSLLAGARLSSDFFIWDFSIKQRLKALQQNLITGK